MRPDLRVSLIGTDVITFRRCKMLTSWVIFVAIRKPRTVSTALTQRCVQLSRQSLNYEIYKNYGRERFNGNFEFFEASSLYSQHSIAKNYSQLKYIFSPNST